MRINGSVIGSVVASSESSATGIWGLQNVELANRSNSWPIFNVTSGLILNLDASNANSYPGSGTTWYDLSGNNKNGTLTNGPTFSSANGGSIVYDGVDDSVICSLVTSDANNVTMEAWFKATTLPGSLILYNGNSATSGYGFTHGACGATSTTLYVFFGGLNCNVVSYAGMTTNVWYQAVYTRTTTPSILNILYINGISRSTNNSSNPNAAPAGSTSIGTQGYQGNISIARIYNRALSANEVLQNFNAARARFGL